MPRKPKMQTSNDLIRENYEWPMTAGQVSKLTGVENGLVKILLKIVGIGYLTEFAAGILQDFGAPGVADKIVLGGKLTIVAVSLPLIFRVLTVLNAFLGLI